MVCIEQFRPLFTGGLLFRNKAGFPNNRLNIGKLATYAPNTYTRDGKSRAHKPESKPIHRPGNRLVVYIKTPCSSLPSVVLGHERSRFSGFFSPVPQLSFLSVGINFADDDGSTSCAKGITTETVSRPSCTDRFETIFGCQ